eukprot:Clim_evm32s215 gene=Clim_evmTU32s215
MVVKQVSKPKGSSRLGMYFLGFLAIQALLVALFVQFVKPSQVLPTGQKIWSHRKTLTEPTHRAKDTTAVNTLTNDLVKAELADPLRGFPLQLTPKTPGQDAKFLAEYVTKNHDVFEKALIKHGAIRFRGFDLSSPKDFETVITAFDPWLNNTYLGVSERPKIPGTEYVFAASEFPYYLQVPQHSEMSFLQHTSPKNLHFFAEQPSPVGGETPLFDNEAVWENMDPAVKAKFEKHGMKTIRKYRDESHSTWDLLKTKSWQTMFNTKDRDEAFRLAESEGLHPKWEGDVLVLHDIYSGRTHHPHTGREIWYNHVPTFHIEAQHMEHETAAVREERWYPAFLSVVTRAIMNGYYWLYNGDVSLNSYYGDGSDIPTEDMVHIRSLLWKYGVIGEHQKGDIVIIDNRQIGHGRNYFYGPRSVLAAWSTYPPGFDPNSKQQMED